MLARSTRIESSATALVLILTVQVAINRAEANRSRTEAEDARSHAVALDRRADSFESSAAEAERKLQEILDNPAVTSEAPNVQPLEPYALSPRETARVENCGVSLVYDRLKRGEYQAIRDGSRTKILFASIKARRAKLQAAVIKPVQSLSEERRRRRAAVKE
jgi:hypothetical protein